MGRLDEPLTQPVWERVFTRSAAALRDADVPFAVMGSLALWARSGSRPATTEDIDFAIRDQDIVRAAEALEGAGFRVEIPVEDWLIKAWPRSGDEQQLFVDLIYAPAGLPVTDEVLARADLAPVLALNLLVLSATDIMVTKLASLNQQRVDYVSSLEMARILREQVDWDELEDRTGASPFAEAFFLLARRLAIDPRARKEDFCVDRLIATSRATDHARVQRRELQQHLQRLEGALHQPDGVAAGPAAR